MNDNKLLATMLSYADERQVPGLSRFFKCGEGEYGEGDRFLGIKVPVTRAVAKECWQTTEFPHLEECITSPYHEVRLAALLTLIEIFNHARRDEALRRRCIDFYLAHTAYINNWDLVDLSCYKLLGEWLTYRDRSLLYHLAANGATRCAAHRHSKHNAIHSPWRTRLHLQHCRDIPRQTPSAARPAAESCGMAVTRSRQA